MVGIIKSSKNWKIVGFLGDDMDVVQLEDDVQFSEFISSIHRNSGMRILVLSAETSNSEVVDGLRTVKSTDANYLQILTDELDKIGYTLEIV